MCNEVLSSSKLSWQSRMPRYIHIQVSCAELRAVVRRCAALCGDCVLVPFGSVRLNPVKSGSNIVIIFSTSFYTDCQKIKIYASFGLITSGKYNPSTKTTEVFRCAKGISNLIKSGCAKALKDWKTQLYLRFSYHSQSQYIPNIWIRRRLIIARVPMTQSR